MSLFLSNSKSILTKFSHLRISCGFDQKRQKGHLNRPRLRNPFWFTRKTRTLHEDSVTPENKGFIKEILHDKYGPPAIIKGVQTFKNASASIVKTEEIERHEWTPKIRRCGVLAKKIGVYPMWLNNGIKIYTTLLHVADNHVIKYIPQEEYNPAQIPRVKNYKQKFGCLLVGAESTDPSLLTKEYCGLFKDSGIMPKKHLARFLVSPEAVIPAGTPLNATHFRIGDYVDVRGKTVDHGFQGVCFRWDFKGMPASHGVTKTHRRPGNIGGGGEKGRVWPGTKLPGHMGNRWRVVKGLQIVRINTKYNVIWVNGNNVAGDTNGLLYIYDTILPLKRPNLKPPLPTSFDDELKEPLPEDIWQEDVHNFKDQTIFYKEEVQKAVN